MYSVLGWTNVTIAALMLLPFVLVKFIKNKDGALKKIQKVLLKMHRPLSGLLLVSAIVHGYLALGTFALHTGTLLVISLVVSGIFASIFIMKKKKIFFNLHRMMASIFIVLLFVHLLFPWILTK
ncbi:MAG: hypothetical protein AB1Z23_01075 [Eubacteriales bacterium]